MLLTFQQKRDPSAPRCASAELLIETWTPVSPGLPRLDLISERPNTGKADQAHLRDLRFVLGSWGRLSEDRGQFGHSCCLIGRYRRSEQHAAALSYRRRASDGRDVDARMAARDDNCCVGEVADSSVRRFSSGRMCTRRQLDRRPLGQHSYPTWRTSLGVPLRRTSRLQGSSCLDGGVKGSLGQDIHGRSSETGFWFTNKRMIPRQNTRERGRDTQLFDVG